MWFHYKSKEYETKRLENYINKVAEIKGAVYKFAQTDWDTGSMMLVDQTSCDVVSFYEEILNELSTFYPYKPFEGDPRKFLMN